MAYLLFAVAVAPGEAAKWIVLSIGLAGLVWQQRATPAGAVPWLLLGLLGWAVVSLTWASSWPDGLNRLWQLCLLAGAVMVGWGLSTKRWHAACLGLAAGMAVNGALAAGQALGWLDVDAWLRPDLGDAVTLVHVVGGGALFVNKNQLAEAGLLGLICLLIAGRAAATPTLRARRLIVWAPIAVLCMLAAALPMSAMVFGAASVLAIAGLASSFDGLRTRIFIIVVGGLLLGAAGAAVLAGDVPRQTVWRLVMLHLTPWGHGPGSLWHLFPLWAGSATTAVFGFPAAPLTAHNDFLSLAHELGLGSLFWWAIVGLALGAWRHDRLATILLVAVLLLGLGSFPLYTPVGLGLAGLCAGRLCGLRHRLRRRCGARRGPVPGSVAPIGAEWGACWDPAGGGGTSAERAHPREQRGLLWPVRAVDAACGAARAAAGVARQPESAGTAGTADGDAAANGGYRPGAGDGVAARAGGAGLAAGGGIADISLSRGG